MEGLPHPDKEQAICLECGLCCDASIFECATLRPGERGSLPEKMEEASFSKNGRDFFRLPCPYFSGKCTIYEGRRAIICGSFRCKLLIEFAAGKTDFDTALAVVRQAVKIKRELISEFEVLHPHGKTVSFRDVLAELSGEGKSSGASYLLLSRCNILEALMIRHFRSADDFDRLIME